VILLATMILKHVVDVAEVRMLVVSTSIKVLCMNRPKPTEFVIQLRIAHPSVTVIESPTVVAPFEIVHVVSEVVFLLDRICAKWRNYGVDDVACVDEVFCGRVVGEGLDAVEAGSNGSPFVLFGLGFEIDCPSKGFCHVAVLVSATTD
jgi:hypothetical protein